MRFSPCYFQSQVVYAYQVLGHAVRRNKVMLCPHKSHRPNKFLSTLLNGGSFFPYFWNVHGEMGSRARARARARELTISALYT